MYDASLYYREKLSSVQTPEDFILLTIHRAENTDDPEKLENIVAAINALPEKKFIFPVHPRTKKNIIRAQPQIRQSCNIDRTCRIFGNAAI
ncbi:UDP-N-acetylglucosamine 2-epimerase [Treponema phagedenis]|nr:UDP-N-acetylglucosamine 2-epimerase [Treponema phagedenis]